MFKNLFVFALVISLFSCSDNNEDIQEYTDQALMEVSLETRSGPSGCFELIFPISFIMADGTMIEIEAYGEAKAAFRAWKEANPDVFGKPQLSFPIEMINQEGELITIGSREELIEIRKECRAQFVQSNGRRCFKVVYPVTISFPDNTTAEAASRREVKSLLRAWKIDNLDSDVKPSLVFPIELENLQDGTIVTVNSKEEIRQLKEDCR